MENIESSLIYFIVFIFGIVIGSFINCFIWRQNNNMRIVIGRSKCIHCGRCLRWFENIPIFSFLFLHGHCRTCGKKIPFYYIITEFFSGLLFVIVYWMFNEFFQNDLCRLFRDFLMISILLTIFIGDWLYQIIWTEIVFAGIIIGFLFNFFIMDVSTTSMLFGLLFGGGFFLVQYIISKGRWIGGGDVRFGMMMGIWLGFPVTIVAIFIAYIIGAIFSTPFLILKKKTYTSKISFGPFLAVATLWALYFGQHTIDWYLNLVKW